MRRGRSMWNPCPPPAHQRPPYRVHILGAVQVGRDAAVAQEHFVVQQRGQWQGVKHLHRTQTQRPCCDPWQATNCEGSQMARPATPRKLGPALHLHDRLPHRQRGAPLALATEAKQHRDLREQAVAVLGGEAPAAAARKPAAWFSRRSTSLRPDSAGGQGQDVALTPSPAASRPHLGALVVAAQQVDAVWVAQLEGKQGGHNLQAHGPCGKAGAEQLCRRRELHQMLPGTRLVPALLPCIHAHARRLCRHTGPCTQAPCVPLTSVDVVPQEDPHLVVAAGAPQPLEDALQVPKLAVQVACGTAGAAGG